MDLGTILGMTLNAVIVVVVLILDGGTPGELFSHPSAILLTLVGSLVAASVSAPFNVTLSLPKLLLITIKGVKRDFTTAIEQIATMADKARREGLLALETDARDISDSYLKKGVMMVVDGIDPAQVRAILEIDTKQMHERHAHGSGMLEAAGGYSPTFGIIGTVMGLISVLQDLSQPETLGRSIAGAFLATLWGLLSANMIYLPLAGKLKTNSETEIKYRNMLVEGILSMQAGENPRIIKDKLSAYLPPSAREKVGEQTSKQEARAEA